jgi:hypothetical protein
VLGTQQGLGLARIEAFVIARNEERALPGLVDPLETSGELRSR